MPDLLVGFQRDSTPAAVSDFYRLSTKFAANPTSLDWIYDYKVDWDEQAIEPELVPA